jgi:hypothetical protein
VNRDDLWETAGAIRVYRTGSHEVVGFLLDCGEVNEAFTRDGRSLGRFETDKAAIEAVRRNDSLRVN